MKTREGTSLLGNMRQHSENDYRKQEEGRQSSKQDEEMEPSFLDILLSFVGADAICCTEGRKKDNRERSANSRKRTVFTPRALGVPTAVGEAQKLAKTIEQDVREKGLPMSRKVSLVEKILVPEDELEGGEASGRKQGNQSPVGGGAGGAGSRRASTTLLPTDGRGGGNSEGNVMQRRASLSNSSSFVSRSSTGSPTGQVAQFHAMVEQAQGSKLVPRPSQA